MNSPLSLTSLRTRLLRGGLPGDYVEHLMDELREHHEDAIADSTQCRDEADASRAASLRLGHETALVKRTVAEYRRRYFAGRHPVLTFVAAPWPALFAAWTFYLLTFFFLAELFSLELEGILALRIFNGLLVFGVPVAVAAVFARLATRSCQGPRWIVVSTVLIAVAAFSLKTQIQAATGGPGTGRYTIGLGIVPAELLSPVAWLQGLVPSLVLVGVAARRAAMRRPVLDA